MAELAEVRARTQELDGYCQQTLWPQVEALELKHKIDTSALKLKLVQGGPAIIIGALLVRWAQQPSGTIKTAVLYLGLAAFCVGCFLILREAAKLARQYSARAAAMRKLTIEIKQSLVRFLDPSFSYEPYCEFPKAAYHSSDIFPTSYDRGSAEDRFVGTLGKTKFLAMKIATYKKTTKKNSQGKSQVVWQPIYRGLFFQAEFNKNFAGQTTVRTDSGEKVIGGLARTAQRLKTAFSKSTLVELENPNFEAEFQVHSTDAVQARYILTPAFMERLLELKKKHGVDIQIAFQNSKIIVGIPRAEAQNPFLELTGGVFDLNNLTASSQKLTSEVFAVLELVEDLDLNNRLSKAS